MTYSKPIAILLATVVCATAFASDSVAQSRGRAPGGRGPTVGRAVPRGPVPRGVSPRVIVRAPLRSYYYPYFYGYRPGFYGYRPGISLGFYYGYPYGYYGYPYGAYGYGYGGYYPAGYGYGGDVRPGGYAGAAYGGIRIQGAPSDAQVYVDGYYAGIVDDFDSRFQRLDLAPGSHQVEIRTAGSPLTYDVNVTPGQTLTIHANVR